VTRSRGASPSSRAPPAAPGAASRPRSARPARQSSAPAAAARAAAAVRLRRPPGDIEETAELVTRLGGTGVAVQVDHLDRDRCAPSPTGCAPTTAGSTCSSTNVWGAERLKGGPAEWNTPIWAHDLDKGLRILRLGVETHLSRRTTCFRCSSPTGRPARRGHRRHRRVQRRHLPDLGVLRLGQGVGEPAGVHAGTRAGSAWCDGRRGDARVAAFGDDARRVRGHRGHLARRAGHRLARRPPRRPTDRAAGFAASESPRFVGRAVAALAADPDRPGGTSSR
jgi:hypothetical protein